MRELAERLAVALAAVLIAGCVTRTYRSPRSAERVAECIRARWTHSTATGIPVPVSSEKSERGYFVTPALPRPLFSPLIFGLKHPLHAVWAEVTEVPDGSATEYRRALQFTHSRIDRAVIECQEEDPEPVPR